MIEDYGKVYALGRDRSIATILEEPVLIEEKVDGSQFSFAKIDGELVFKSRNVLIDPDAAGNFTAGVQALLEVAHLVPEGFVFRGEYLSKPRHNVLCYERVPERHVVIWEAEHRGTRLSPVAREDLARRMCLEPVQAFGWGEVRGLDDLKDILSRPSMLGGKMEGVVLKRDGMAAKVVSDEFREVKAQPRPKPTDADFLKQLGSYFSTPARWEKAVQFLRDGGTLTGSPKDIGQIIRRVQDDIFEEHGDEIRESLFQHARKQLANAATAGVPEWYLSKLGG